MVSNRKAEPDEPIESYTTLAYKQILICGCCFYSMFFFDRNDLTLQWKRVSELKKLQHSEKIMNQQISGTKSELELLKSNPATLEKYARERYLMKKDNEDLFIITPKPLLIK